MPVPDKYATYAKLNINIDGYARAYHRRNYDTDAVIHLCNAADIYLPDGSHYHGAESNTTCTGKFMTDLAKIEAAGWSDPHVGLVRWYGVLGTGDATIHGHTIKGVKPVLQRDGSGYYVSPTALFDASIADVAEQRRYVDPSTVPAAVMSADLKNAGIRLGSCGVAWSRDTRIAAPFIVGDIGPRVGEGTPALARKLAGLAPVDTITHKNRFAGQVDTPSILWVFFGDEPLKYDGAHPDATVEAIAAAFEHWGGLQHLQAHQAAPA